MWGRRPDWVSGGGGGPCPAWLSSCGRGVRIGTVRRPPRGVPKAEFASRDYYDVWLPSLAPSPELVRAALSATNDVKWAHKKAT